MEDIISLIDSPEPSPKYFPKRRKTSATERTAPLSKVIECRFSSACGWSPSLHVRSYYLATLWTLSPVSYIQLTDRCTTVAATWPSRRIPVEIFNAILQLLPRGDAQSMRLVNKEFESNVSSFLFRIVVVPFRPEIYGAKRTNPATANREPGLLIFKGFGSHIRKFAMSFEIDHSQLYNPPGKLDQENVVTFWGTYKWPFPHYNRFHSLEASEESADETRLMARALAYLSNVDELALSIDGALGWLQGPDINLNDQYPVMPPLVFGSSRFAIEPDPREAQLQRFAQKHLPSDYDLDALEGMLLEETGTGSESMYHAMEMLSAEFGDDDVSSDFSLTKQAATVSPLCKLRAAHREFKAAEARYPLALQGSNDAHFYALNSAAEAFTLRPSDLKGSQKELLLEVEWAQRAFIQSWTISIADNPDAFFTVTKLTLMRIPSHHLSMLKNESFWQSLHDLNSVTLAVIPDWREMQKDPAGYIDDIRLEPSIAMDSVYEILKDHISHRRGITELNIEWINGGEEASGLFARNRHVMPAPFVPDSEQMLTRQDLVPQILDLPHVKILRLKNCWSSPHIFKACVKSMSDKSLQKLELTGFSLCLPIPEDANPQPGIPAHAHHAQLFAPPFGALANLGNLGNLGIGGDLGGGDTAGQGGDAQPNHMQQVAAAAAAPFFAQWQAGAPANDAAFVPLPVPAMNNLANNNWIPNAIQQPPEDPCDWVAKPPVDSWVDVIDHITPTDGLAYASWSADTLTDSGPPRRRDTSLRTINLRSCGYVNLDIDISQRNVGPNTRLDRILAELDGAAKKRRNGLDYWMLTTTDYMLGRISHFIKDEEMDTLNTVWSLVEGWDEEMTAKLKFASYADGIVEPGKGRFHGLLTVDPFESVSWMGDQSDMAGSTRRRGNTG